MRLETQMRIASSMHYLFRQTLDIRNHTRMHFDLFDLRFVKYRFALDLLQEIFIQLH